MSWAAFLDRVTLKFPFPIEIRAHVPSRREPHHVELRVALDVPDINTGEMTRVYVNDFPPDFDDIVKRDDPARYLRNLVLRTLAHELDECFYVDGVKLRDPHTLDTYVPKYI